MAYQYDDYITLTDKTAQETRLRLHIQEVSKQITADVSKGGSSRATGQLMVYRTELRNELRELEAVSARNSGFGCTLVNMNGSRK